MQLKRILVSLLIAIMIISTAVVTISANDAVTSAGAEFEIALETTTDISNAKPGDVVEMNVVIKNNPGAAFIQVKLTYDSVAITPVVDDNGDVVVDTDIYSFHSSLVDKTGIQNVEYGDYAVLSMMSDTKANANITDTGVVAKLSFKITEEYKKTACDASVKATVLAYTVDRVALATNCSANINLNGHNLSELEVITAATCTTDGLGKQTCSVCNETLEVVIPAAHTVEVIAATTGNCQTKGTTEGSKCSVCNEILVAVTETELGDHVLEDYSDNEIKDAQKCSVCGTIVGGTSVPSLLWLWIVIAVVVVIGAAAVVFFVVKKK